jgi:hypothetical protein
MPQFFQGWLAPVRAGGLRGRRPVGAVSTAGSLHLAARYSRRNRQRWQLAGVLIFLLLLAGCNTSCASSSSSSTTTTTRTPTTGNTTYVAPTPCVSPEPDECRFWVRHVIAVAIALDAKANDANSLGTLVPATLNAQFNLHLTAYSVQNLPPVIAFSSVATVFVVDPTLNDAALLSAIDKINSAIASARDVQGNPTGFIPIQGSPDWIVGVSPDWYGTPSQGGTDHVHGSPDNPPSPTSPGTKATAKPSAPANGPATNVYVLDTGYRDQSQLPAAGVSPAFDNLKTVWDETDPIASLPTDAAVPPELIPPYEFDQEDPSVATATPAPAYSPSNYKAVDVRDHGLAISELIHWIAPNAKIHLMRVLNDYGVGDLQTLLATLSYLLQNGPSGSIINLSLDYGPPVDCLAQYWSVVKDTTVSAVPSRGAQLLAQQFGTTGCKAGGTSDLLTDDPRYLAIGDAIEELIQLHKDIVVAAAGNSSTAAGTENANMPAAFCGVVAVGALTTPSGTLATFSNRPDSPCLMADTTPTVHSSATAFHVSAGSPTDAKAWGVNVCSLHFQKILPYDAAPPANGLALWSGTSFATALVSGNIAANPSIVPAGGGAVPIANQTAPC